MTRHEYLEVRGANMGQDILVRYHSVSPGPLLSPGHTEDNHEKSEKTEIEQLFLSSSLLYSIIKSNQSLKIVWTLHICRRWVSV